MNLRIAYYVVAFAISLAAFAGASVPVVGDLATDGEGGEVGAARAAFKGAVHDWSAAIAAEDAAKARAIAADPAVVAAAAAQASAYARLVAARDGSSEASDRARVANSEAAWGAALAAVPAYGMAASVALAAFAGAFILDKRRDA